MATIHLHQTTTATPEQFLCWAPVVSGSWPLADLVPQTVKAIEARNYQPRQAQS